MALTAEGKQLTEAHRLAQIAIAAQGEAVARSLWSTLDVSDLDRSTPMWLGANVQAARRFHGQSEELAASYVSEYRGAELGSAAGSVVRPGFDAALQAQTLLLAGPVRVKLLVGKGQSASGAKSGALSKYSGIMRRQVMSGGRMLVDATTKADKTAVGWRRVTDGDPCTFCAMLATRGPVYGSADVARTVGNSGLRYHGYCGCTAEIVYGEWKPTEREQEYVNSYEKAAAEATEVDGRRVAPKPGREEDTILYRMRRDGIFRDSPLSRNK